LALKDVRRAVSTLQTEIAKLLSEDNDDDIGFDFDSSEYFHLSYRLATAFPDLWESNLIRSYHSSQPPVHLLNSDIYVNTSQDDAIFGNSLLATLFRRTIVVSGAMILYFGTINIRLQKMVITISQPLILAGICWMFYEMAHAQWIVIFPCLGVLLFLGYQFWHHPRAGSSGDGKIGVDADDDASSKRHSKQSRSLDKLSLRRIYPHDQHEETNGRSEQLEVACTGGTGDEVRPMEAVAGSIRVPGSDETVHGADRAVALAGNEDLPDAQSSEAVNNRDEGEGYDEIWSDGQSA
jgi:hypothetical protein